MDTDDLLASTSSGEKTLKAKWEDPYRVLFRHVRERPDMFFGHQPTYDEAVAFVLGCDAGNAKGLLRGFREWILVRLPNDRSNLFWPWLVRDLVASLTADCDSPVDDERRAIETLWIALDSFLVERAEPGGMARIFEEYAR